MKQKNSTTNKFSLSKVGFKKPGNLQSKIFLWLLLNSLIPFLAVSSFFLINHYNLLEEPVLQNFTLLSKLEMNNVENYFTDQKNNVLTVSRSFRLSGLMPQLKKAYASKGYNSPEYKKAAREVSPVINYYIREHAFHFFRIFLLNNKGEIIYSSDSLFVPGGKNSRMLISTLKEKQPGFFNQPRVALSNYIYFPFLKKRMMLVKAPVYMKEKLLGEVMAEVHFLQFLKKQAPLTIYGNSGKVVLGQRENGKVLIFDSKIMQNGDSLISQTINKISGLPIIKATQNLSGWGLLKNDKGEKVFAMWRPLKTNRWGIVVTINQADLFRKVRRTEKFLIFLGIFVFLITFLLARVSSRNISRPVVRLKKGLEAVAKGDLDYRVQINRSDEIGQLSRAFNHMAGQLKNLTVSKKEMEKEIRQRKESQSKLEASRKAALSLMQDANQERERTTKALKKLEESTREIKKLQVAMKQSPLMVVITNEKGIIEYVNRRFEKVTGYTRQEIIGHYHNIFKEGKLTPLNASERWEQSPDASVWRAEFLNQTKSGRFYWEAITLAPVKNESGDITHYIAIKEDITERKQIQQNLKNLASIVSSSRAIIIGINLNGHITSWNAGAKNVYGYSKQEIEGKPVSVLLPGSEKDKIISYINRVKSGENIENTEITHLCKEGTPIEISMTLSGIYNESDLLTGISLVGYDITRQKELERQLIAEKEKAEEATRAKSLFLANMSHEIRTPMNAILGFAEILYQRIKDPVQKEYLTSMQNSGKALLNLINDLLDFSKAEAGKLELYEQSTDVYYLVHDIESIFRLKAHQKNLDFIVEIDKDVPHYLLLDELKIRQILLNLTSNAIKFTDKGIVKISIQAEKVVNSKADLIIEVSDTGKGIPPEFHKKIFQLFEQQDKSITRKYGGTGLGLAITMDIVKLMKGHIFLDSKEGKGSTFRVVLPAIPLTGEKAARKEAAGLDMEKLLFDPATVLIVDDTPSNIEVIKVMLENQPFVLLEAPNGKVALEMMEKHKADLVFMDIRMPEMDGITAVQAIRNHEGWSHIPVIALSASSTDFDSAQLIKKGFNDHVRKPATQSEIAGILAKYLKYTSTEEISDDGLETLSRETILHFSKIEVALEKQILPHQQALLGIRPRAEVKKLAKELISVGEKYKSKEVLRYGERLLTANENFLLDNEKDLIDNLPNFVKRLKQLFNEQRTE